MRFLTLALPFAFGAQLAAAIPTVELEVSSYPGVSADAMEELRNATDFSTIDATKWTTFLDQPHEVLAAWDPTAKQRMFSLLYDLMELGTGLEKRQTQSSIRQKIGTKKQQVDSEITTDEVKDKGVQRCADSTTCTLCISAAAAVGIGKVAACATIALTAEAIVGPPTSGAATAAVYTAFVACVGPVVGAFLLASGGCIAVAKAIP